MNFFNPWAILVSALIPTLVGMLWYSKLLFEKPWMSASGMTEEKMKSGNMAVIFGVSFLFALMLTMMLHSLSIHQMSIFSLLVNEPGFQEQTGEAYNTFMSLMEKYGTLHRGFGHGVAHGLFAGIFIVLPVMGANALFERKGFKYILVNVGYWTVTIALMCGVICGWPPAS